MHRNYAIVSQIKNKAIRIKDWVRYHSSEGFNIFIIFDDGSTDETVDLLNELSEEREINLHVFQTLGPFNEDGKEVEVEPGKYLKSRHKTSLSLAQRICNSFTRGCRFLQDTYPGTVCTFIDDDEFLVTEEDKKVTEVIDEIFEERTFNNSQLLVQTFDVRDQYELEEWYVANERANQIWNANSLHAQAGNAVMWRNRSKCIIKADSMGKNEPCHSMHGYRHGSNDSTFHWTGTRIAVKDEGDFVRDYAKLRIYHFRKPEQKGTSIKFTTNNTLLNKMKKIRGLT